jgi:hypothetical protein
MDVDSISLTDVVALEFVTGLDVDSIRLDVDSIRLDVLELVIGRDTVVDRGTRAGASTSS